MSLSVLVVDDSAVMRAMILKSLRIAKVPVGEVYEASNGQEGLEGLQQHWIDLAIVDINMPVMDGEQMVELAQADPETAGTPIIVVSTEGSETRINRLINRGVRFVHKPFAPEVIRDVIFEMIGVRDD
jgi:two-component system, chemotaxis family, chemotaxis protein CheY